MRTLPALLPILLMTPSLAKTADLAELQRMIAHYAPVELRVDTASLSRPDSLALAKLVAAARLVDDIFLTQYWSGNRALYAKLRKDATPLGKARLRYFVINKGPWSALDDLQAFLPGVPPRKPLGANFYPPDLTKQEFDTWVKTLTKEQKQEAEGFFTVIRREGGKLQAVPFSQAYAADLRKLSKLLHAAAALTPNESLKKFLDLRADAFLSND